MNIKKIAIIFLTICCALCLCAVVFAGCEILHEHENVQHHSAKSATCGADGNIEYWYCPDCDTYFSDSALTEEISKSDTVLPKTAAHQSVVHTEAQGESCTVAGNIEYWHCTDCGKYFSNSALTTEVAQADTVIAATNHRNAQHVTAVAATCKSTGNIEYWHCNDCDKYFSNSTYTNQITQAQTVEAINANNHTDVEHEEAVAATCVAEGNIEYWHCNGCDRYFADSDYTEEKTEQTIVTPIDDNNHSYGEFVYDYTDKKYTKTCSRSAEHVVDQVAGIEDYPYLVETVAQLSSANAAGGYLKLTESLSFAATLSIDKDLNIDLNGHSLTSSAASVISVKAASTQQVTISNGKIECTYADANGRCFYINSSSDSITIDSCELVSTSMGFYVPKTVTPHIIINDSTINGITHGVYNLGSGKVSMTNTHVVAPTGVYTRGAFEMDGGSVTATKLGIQISTAYSGYETIEESYYTNVSIKNATITTTGSSVEDGVTVGKVGVELIITKAKIESTTFNTSGTCVTAFRDTKLEMTGCTMTSEYNLGLQGNGTVDISKSTCGINTDIKLTDCNITAPYGIYLPQVDSQFVMEGGKIDASITGIEVRAGQATLKGVEIKSEVNSSEDFSATPNGSGTTVNGAAVAVSQHTTHNDILVTLDGCTLEGYYAIYESYLQDGEPTSISITLEGTNTLTGLVHFENCEIPELENDQSYSEQAIVANSQSGSKEDDVQSQD